ncbi:hypothetical protein MSG28_013904 [Choristoneura fumiferana]|uniref:Uncharacterized protein n=1 Tax=Choristoneura fumiferana TaxID=7141 RepID=A0ACC0K9I7_CHOFU|nr:hypothetical protein MSG28_013904 [Choristoneura fumiferana]
MDTSSASNFTGCLTLHAETQQCKHCCFTAGLASKMVVAIRADLAQGPTTCKVAIVLALVGAVAANPVSWGGLGSVVIPGGGVSLSSSIINHGLSIPVVKPIISAPIITAPIIRTPIIPAPVIRAPVITSLGWGGLGWGGLGGLGGLGYGWGGLSGWSGKGWH